MSPRSLEELPGAVILGLIRFYQLTFSAVAGRQCRYLPTCSDYAAEAVFAYGAWPGSWMALARVCRCHPLGAAGFDPPPGRLPPAPWYAPWRYGRWRLPHDRARSSAASP